MPLQCASLSGRPALLRVPYRTASTIALFTAAVADSLPAKTDNIERTGSHLWG